MLLRRRYLQVAQCELSRTRTVLKLRDTLRERCHGRSGCNALLLKRLRESIYSRRHAALALEALLQGFLLFGDVHLDTTLGFARGQFGNLSTCEGPAGFRRRRLGRRCCRPAARVPHSVPGDIAVRTISVDALFASPSNAYRKLWRVLE